MLILLGAHLAEHHGIDDLQMRRIGGKRQMNPVVVELAVRRRTEMILDVAGALDRVGIGRAALEFMKQRAMRLAHHLGQHVQASAMRHAHHDFLHPEIAAALDDLFQRRDQRFGAVQTKPLGAGEFQIAEFLKTLGLDQFHQDGATFLAGKTDFLVRALDALLNPCLLRGVRNMHELDAERLAVGALADRDDLAQRGVFHAQHMIEEDLAVEIAVDETVGARIEFLAIARRLDPERVELGVKMAAHAIGPDQHQRAHRIARRLMDVGRRQLGALGLRLGGELGSDRLFNLRPVAVERGGQLVAGRQRPVVPAPGRSFGVLQDVARLIFQAPEKLLPFCVDGSRVFPAASIAGVWGAASPLPPEMIAPAWPMRRPGGAVTPAMKPTIGFLRPRLASSLRNGAASSSAEPPISPIITIEVVLGSARNISSTSMNSVPLTGSPPIPTAVVWPRPSWVVWNTAS